MAYFVEQKTDIISFKLFIGCSGQNLPGMFWKMDYFEHLIIRVRKAKSEEENEIFSFNLVIDNCEIILFFQVQEKIRSVIDCIKRR